MTSEKENHLIKLQSLYVFSSSLAGLFLQIFLFKLSGFLGVVIFNFWLFAALLIAYVSSGYSLRLWSTRTLIRIGLMLLVLGWFVLMVLQDSAKNYIIPLGLLFGLGHGFYWSGFNLSQYILTHSARRAHYFGKVAFLTNVSTALAPFIAGLMVKVGNDAFHSPTRGYYLLFGVAFILQLYIVSVASNLPRHSGVRFSLKEVFNFGTSQKWRLVLLQQFINGLYDAAFSTLNVVLIYSIITNESSVGLLKTMGAFLAAGASYIAGKQYKRHPRIVAIGAVCATGSMVYFGLNQTLVGAIVLMLVYSIGAAFLDIPVSVAVLSGYDETKASWQDKYHVFIQRDAVQGIGRVMSYILVFVLFIVFDKIEAARTWVLLSALVPLFTAWMLHKLRAQAA